MHSASDARGPYWKWMICGLLLLATTLNYMDRQTLSQTVKRVTAELDMDNTHYGRVEFAFGIGFAIGAPTVGYLVDRFDNIRLFYPVIVALWSLAGIATGFVRSYEELALARFLLGVCEAGHWPCALKTTQRILTPADRTMGNSILQGGASIGAIVTPIIVLGFLVYTDSWRYPFLAIGAIGICWIGLWLLLVRPGDLTAPRNAAPAPVGEMRRIYLSTRFWILAFTVISINLTWHFYRAWMPKFLQDVHSYSEQFTQLFSSAYYLTAEAGVFTIGFATLYLARRGMSVHGSRLLMFGVCSLLTLLSLAVAVLPAGPVLLGVLLLIAFGGLGLFPVYYSFSQELTTANQGKVSGSLSCLCWLAVAVMQLGAGMLIQKVSYAAGLALVGLPPLLAFLAILFLWRPAVARPVEPIFAGTPAVVPEKVGS